MALVLYVFCRNGGLKDQFKIEKFNIKSENSKNQLKIQKSMKKWNKNMSHFSYACKTEGENGISRLISETA